MRFADIKGHDDIKRRLRELVDNDRIPHALLLEGPPGAAKFALARAFTKYLHCTDRTPDGDSCGKCPSCLQHDTFNHIDTIYSFPVVKKNSKPTISDDYASLFHDFLNEYPYMDFEHWLEALDNINAQPKIFVEEGQELLRRLTYKARQSRFKVVLLWLPERMNEDTANKLLKLVEEPFGDTIFLMVSNNPRGILPTIYSRTQRIGICRYSDAEVEEILQESGIAPEAAHDASLIAGGDVNEALKLANVSEERLRYFQLFVDLMRKAYARKVGELRQWSVDVAGLGREPAMQFIDYCSRLIRESFLMHLNDPRLLTLNKAELAFTIKFFPFINEKNVEDMATLFDDARRDIAGNANGKIVFFDLAVRVIMLIRRK
ncbi:MAG: DNA polymerase III subunit delta [Bacteroidales bacterium]|nr:DNA polymerase III subunit delta [Bacteroidales bacterium]